MHAYECWNEASASAGFQDLLEESEPPVMVFVNQKKSADALAKALSKLGFRCAAHSLAFIYIFNTYNGTNLFFICLHAHVTVQVNIDVYQVVSTPQNKVCCHRETLQICR